MTLYYRGPDVLITDQVFAVRSGNPEPERFRIDELRDVHVVNGGAARWRLRPSVYELWATYRNVLVLLFRASDSRVFGQVSRGLMRALEAREDRLERFGGSGIREYGM